MTLRRIDEGASVASLREMSDPGARRIAAVGGHRADGRDACQQAAETEAGLGVDLVGALARLSAGAAEPEGAE